MNLNQSPSAPDGPPGISPQRRTHPLTWILASLLLILLPGYFLWRSRQLSAAQQLIQDCSFHHHCGHIISALETLVKANHSLQFSRLSNTHLAQAHLEHAHLENSLFNHTHLEHAHLQHAHLDSSSLFLAHLEHAYLQHAHLAKSHLEHAHLEKSHLDQAQLNSSHLQGTHLQGTHLYQVNLAQADLSRAHLVHAYLYRADLSDANLERANLASAYFHRTNLERANLFRTNFIGAQHLSPSQLKSACYWELAFYQGHWERKRGKWIVNEKANQLYLDQLKQDKASDPQEPVDCSRWE